MFQIYSGNIMKECWKYIPEERTNFTSIVSTVENKTDSIVSTVESETGSIVSTAENETESPEVPTYEAL